MGNDNGGISRGFIAASLFCTMTLGAMFGAYNLIALQLAVGHFVPAHSWSHASFQIMGFVLLFLMGISYHAVPKLLGTSLAHPGLARATLWLGVSGLLIRNWGNLAPLVPWPLAAISVGSLLQLLTVVAWAGVLHATWRQARPAKEAFQGFVAAGMIFWIVAAAIEVAGAVHALLAHNPNMAPRWNEPHYSAALFGGTLLWIEGMFLRTGPGLLGLQPARQRLVRASLALGISGALVLVTGGLVGISRLGHVLSDAGLILAAGSLASFAFGVRILERRTTDAEATQARDMRLAFAGALLFGAIAVPYAFSDLLGRRPASLVFDGARHAFALGFVTIALFGMAARIVPAVTGTRLRLGAVRSLGIVVIALGIVLRETEVVSAVSGSSSLLVVSGTSGVVAATGVLMACVSILASIHEVPAHASERETAAEPVAVLS